MKNDKFNPEKFDSEVWNNIVYNSDEWKKEMELFDLEVRKSFTAVCNFDPCVSCGSFNIEEISYEGYFEFEGFKYPMKTLYLKCNECLTEYIGQHQIKENQKHLSEIKTNRAQTFIH